MKSVLLISDTEECLVRPLVKPINCATIDHTGEHPATISKLLPDWGECKHNMQIFSH